MFSIPATMIDWNPELQASDSNEPVQVVRAVPSIETEITPDPEPEIDIATLDVVSRVEKKPAVKKSFTPQPIKVSASFDLIQGRHTNCIGKRIGGGTFDCSSTVKELQVEPQRSCFDYVDKYSNKYGVSTDLMIRIIKAESGGNPYAKNNQSTASGCAQFIRTSYESTLRQMGREWVTPFDAETNVEAMAWKIAHGGIGAWDASKNSWNK